MKNNLNKASLAIALSLLTMQVHAADLFTVNVPVEFKSLHPDIVGVDISCRLKSKDPVTSNLGYAGKNLPYSGAMGKTVSVTPVNGNVAPQTLKFVFSTPDFDAQELKNLSLVTQAFCNMNLKGKDGGSYNPAAASASAVIIAPKPGTQLSTTVTANF